jgi:hypothetical protein
VSVDALQIVQMTDIAVIEINEVPISTIDNIDTTEIEPGSAP